MCDIAESEPFGGGLQVGLPDSQKQPLQGHIPPSISRWGVDVGTEGRHMTALLTHWHLQSLPHHKVTAKTHMGGRAAGKQ